MKSFFFFVATFMTLLSPNKKPFKIGHIPYQSVVVDTVVNAKLNIRALLIDKNKVWYGADKSRFGYYDTETKKQTEIQFAVDTLEFRSIAKTPNNIFVLNAGTPTWLYRTDNELNNGKVVYEENHKKSFYDSMHFWNTTEGIAIGDPVNDCLSILITRDGGNSWKKIPCENLPKTNEGEAAFAASNTNIITKGNKTWVVSGGKKARVFYSSDKGNSWKVFDTPIVQGKAMTGIFSADFYNDRTGFIAGGDYEKQQQDSGNMAITNDGGKTWKLVGQKKGVGYVSCVQFVPNGKGKELVCVGASGLQYSSDSGENWKQLLRDPNYYTIRFQNDSTAFAAGKNNIVRIRFKK